MIDDKRETKDSREQRKLKRKEERMKTRSA